MKEGGGRRPVSLFPLHSLRSSSGSLHYWQSLPTHSHTNARTSFLTRMSGLHTSPHLHTQFTLSLLTHIHSPWEFFLTFAKTEDPVGHLHCSNHAFLPSVSSPTMSFSDFPGTHHSPGSFSSITSFGKTCLRPVSPPKQSCVSLLWGPAKASCLQHRSDHPGLD